MKQQKKIFCKHLTRKCFEIKPKAAIEYNNTTGGVDKTDQFLENYEMTKKRGKENYFSFFTSKKTHLPLESAPFLYISIT